MSGKGVLVISHFLMSWLEPLTWVVYHHLVTARPKCSFMKGTSWGQIYKLKHSKKGEQRCQGDFTHIPAVWYPRFGAAPDFGELLLGPHPPWFTIRASKSLFQTSLPLVWEGWFRDGWMDGSFIHSLSENIKMTKVFKLTESFFTKKPTV